MNTSLDTALPRRLIEFLAPLAIGAGSFAFGITPSLAQVWIEYTNSQVYAADFRKSAASLEGAKAEILHDLRNVEPLSPVQGGIPASRLYSFDGAARDSDNNPILLFTSNLFDYRFWNDTHWNCWGHSFPNAVPESVALIPEFIKNTENAFASANPAQCAVFTDVRFASSFYADSALKSGYGYRADILITRDDGRTHADQIRARKMRAVLTPPLKSGADSTFGR